MEAILNGILSLFNLLARGQKNLIGGLSACCANHPNIMAVYVELATVALVAAAIVLYLRYKQRLTKTPDASIMVTPVAAPAAPDRTHSLTAFICIIAVALILLMASTV